MKFRLLALAAAASLVCGSASGITFGLSTAVTGSPTPATTGIPYGVPSNTLFELVGVIPVVSTVTGTPASMAASVFIPSSSGFNFCGAGSGNCSNDMWAAQWTIVSAPTGIQAVNAYQGSTIKLVNNSGTGATVTLRCQVGQMTGSCIFVTRLQAVSDPLF